MIKICPRCGQEHEKRGKYCSRQCANSHQWSDEDKEKKRKGAKDYLASLSDSEMVAFKARCAKNARDHLCGNGRAGKRGSIKYLLDTNFDLLAWQSKRLRVMMEQDFRCSCCGISEWNGKPITLEVDHIDGNHGNDARDNLRALCPNCHSQTDTWRGRNNKGSSCRSRLAKLRDSYTCRPESSLES